MSGDLLRMDYINSLGQLYGSMSGSFWPITSICVETGLSRIDVIGLSEIVHFSDFTEIKSDDGPCDIEKFYTDYEDAPAPAETLSLLGAEGRGEAPCAEPQPDPSSPTPNPQEGL